jgi:hypothetical protein
MACRFNIYSYCTVNIIFYYYYYNFVSIIHHRLTIHCFLNVYTFHQSGAEYEITCYLDLHSELKLKILTT